MRSRASGAAFLNASLCCFFERALALSELRLFLVRFSCFYICTFFGRAAPDRAGARPYQLQRHRLIKSSNPGLLRPDAVYTTRFAPPLPFFIPPSLRYAGRLLPRLSGKRGGTRAHGREFSEGHHAKETRIQRVCVAPESPT